MNNQSLFAKVRSVLILLVSLLAVSAVWAKHVDVTYLDANGNLQTYTQGYTALYAANSSSSAGSSFTPSSGWYVVRGVVSYNCSDFNFKGKNVSLVLMDGAKLTVKNGDEGCAKFLNLNIYAQSLGDNKGKFEVASLVVGNLNVVGGAISVSGDVEANSVEFRNGSVSVGGGIEAKNVRFINGSVVVAEGVSAVSNADSVKADILFAGATVRAKSYSVSGNVYEAKVGNNLLYGDELGNAYSGALSAEQLASMAGKKVAPAKMVTFVDGSSVSEKAWIPGVIPSDPTRIWKNFLGWYADKSYETSFDFTNFENGATAYAKWENLVEVTYFDDEGKLQTLTEDYTVLIAASSSNTTGVPFTPSSGWYVVSGEVSYDCSDFDFTRKNVNLVLTDGAKLTVKNGNEGCAEFRNLNIYAQSLGDDMGRFEVPSLNVAYAFNVLGGAILTTGGVEAATVLVKNGSVSIGGGIEAIYVRFINGTVVVAEGVSAVSDADSVRAYIQFAGATVKANSYSISGNGKIWIEDNLLYGDEQGNAYSGALSAGQLASMAGKKVAPAKMVTFVDGSSVSEKAWIPGVIPSEPTRIWKKFIGWYADKSYETPLDFTNFESGAIAYAKWENLVEVTYVDEDGVTQTLEDNYTVLVAASSSSVSSSSSAASSSSGVSSSSNTTGVEFSASSGWYVVSGEVSYDCSEFNFEGKDVNLVLMDGAKLTVTNSNNEKCAEFESLFIFAQSLGKDMGQFEVSSLNAGYLVVYGGSISIKGSLEADYVTFGNGSVVVDGGIILNEGGSDVYFAGATVRANSYHLPEGLDIVISSGLVYVDEQGNVYESVLNADKIALIAGQTLSLAKTITFVDGSSVIEKVWVPGEVPSNPTHIWKKFLGWYADKSYQTPFDFTNFESGAIAYAKWENLVDVTYIDEHGVTQTLEDDYTVLVASSPSSSSSGAASSSSIVSSSSSVASSSSNTTGWYVVSGEVLYDCEDFKFNGAEVNLILMDGAKLTVTNSGEECAEFGILKVYAQSLGEKMGQFEVPSLKTGILSVYGGSILIEGSIDADIVEFFNGSVVVDGDVVVKESGAVIIFAGATVWANSYTIPEGDFYAVRVFPGLVYVDEKGNEYRDILDADQIALMASKTLSLAKTITFVDGSSVIEKVWVPGVVPCTPAHKGQKFIGWYADKSYQKPFDFKNFNDGAIAYAKWEDLTEVTYLDEDGKEQRVTPDYVLVGNECTDSEVFMNGGWVLVNGNVSYKNNFAFLARTPYNPKDDIKGGKGDVDLKGGKGDDILYPVDLGDLDVNLILADGAKLTVENDVTEFQTSFNNLAIYAQSTGANKGVFEITSKANAIYVKDNLIINGGDITATSEGSAIYSDNVVVINNGSVTATGSDHGIWGNELVKINDGYISARGYEVIRSFDSVVVNGGSVDAFAYARGDYAETGAGLVAKWVDINGGLLTATAAFAIAANQDVTITGGEVLVASPYYGEYSGYGCFGIGSYWKDVVLKGGKVTALAKDGCRGIYADNSMQKTIYLSGATVKASSYNDSIVVADDMSYYDVQGNSYTGIIHEDGLLELADKYVYPYAPALVITKNSEDKTVATLDGNFNKDMPVVITQETTVEEVEFNRGFTAGRRATVMFPFDVYADNLIGAKYIDEFSYMETIKNDKGDITGLVVHMKGVWDKPAEAPSEICDNRDEDCKASVLLKANKPYTVLLDEGYSSLEIRGAVTLKTNKPEHVVSYGDWEFVGVYQYKKWTEDDDDLQKGHAIYGLVGVAVDGFTIGNFVRVAAGAYINPMRAYLRYNPKPNVQNVLAVKKVARYNVADWNSASVTSELPESILVVRDVDSENGGEHTTVIGQHNTRSDKFALPRSTNRVFDLKGRAYGKDARKAHGAYYGKKVLKK